MSASRRDVKDALLTQRQLCSVTGIEMATTNDWVARKIIKVDETEGWRVKGGRAFKPLTAWRVAIMVDSVKHHEMPLAKAAKIAEVAERLARKGGFLDHWARQLAANQPFVGAVMVFALKGESYDAQIISLNDEGFPNFSSIPNIRERFFKHPFLVIPLSDILADVWQKCAAILAVEKKAAR